MQSRNKVLAREVEAFIAQQKFSEAFTMLKEIKEQDYYLYQPELLQKIISALENVEDVILQNSYLQEAISFIHNIDGVAFSFTSCFPVIEQMAKSLFDAGQNERLDQLLATAQKLANGIHRVRTRFAALAEIAKLYARLQKLDQALATVLLLKDPIEKAKLSANLAVVLLDTGEDQPVAKLLQETQQTIEEINDLEKKSATCLEIAKIIAPFAASETLIAIIQKIESPLSRAKAFLDLVSLFCQKNEEVKAQQIWQQAMLVAEQITNNETKNTILVKIAAMAAQRGDIAAAKAIGEQIKEDSHKFEIVEETIQSLQRTNRLSLDSKFLLQKTIEIYKNIKFHRCSFDLLQAALEEVLRLEEQQQSEILQEIIRIARAEEPLLRNQTFFCIANELSRAGDYGQSLKIVCSIEDNDYQFKALTVCIQNLANQQKILNQSGTLQKILVMLRSKFVEHNSLPLAIIGRHLAINGNFLEAMEIVAEITEEHHKIDALNDICDKFSVAQALANDRQLLNKTFAIIDTIDHFCTHIPIATTAVLLATCGDYARIFPMLQKINNKYYRFKVLRDVIAIFDRDQQALKQNEMIDQVILTIVSDFPEWQGPIIAKIAQSLANFGRYSKAIEMVEQIGDEYYCFEVLRHLLEIIEPQETTAEKIVVQQEILRLVEQMADSFFKSELLCKIFAEDHINKSGYLDDGQRIANAIRGDLFRFEALKEIARSFIVLKQQEAATGLLGQLDEMVEEFKGQETRAMALIEVGQLWLHLGNQEKAGLAYRKSRQLLDYPDEKDVEEH